MDDEMAARDDLESMLGICVSGDPQSGAASPIPEWAGLTHDLGNLLQTATSALNIIDRGITVQPAQVRRAIDGARVSVERACELVRRYLERSLIDPGSPPDTDMADCLAELALLVGGTMDPAISMDIRLGEDLPWVRCDRTGLQNAILNLVLNARAAIAGSGRISVRAVTVVGDGATAEVEISVADNGVGMSPATIERAFDPYFTTKTDGLGGIGLSMVERFVRAANGRLWIESEPGAGSRIIMRLPASPRHQRTGNGVEQ